MTQKKINPVSIILVLVWQRQKSLKTCFSFLLTLFCSTSVVMQSYTACVSNVEMSILYCMLTDNWTLYGISPRITSEVPSPEIPIVKIKWLNCRIGDHFSNVLLVLTKLKRLTADAKVWSRLLTWGLDYRYSPWIDKASFCLRFFYYRQKHM